MKRFSSSVVSLVVSATFMLLGAGTAAQAQEKPVTLKAGLGSSLTGSSHGLGLAKFKELIEKETSGRIKMNIFPDGQMGNDVSMMDSLKMGTLDIMVTSSAPIANTTKTFLVFDLPFLFTSEKIADTVLLD